MTAGKFILNPFALDEVLDNAEPMDPVFDVFEIKELTSDWIDQGYGKYVSKFVKIIYLFQKLKTKFN